MITLGYLPGRITPGVSRLVFASFRSLAAWREMHLGWPTNSGFRLRFKRQIRLRVKRAIAGRNVDSQRQEQNSKRDYNPDDRPNDRWNAGGVGHVHGISGNRGCKRRRKKEDVFQIEQGVQNALHRQETNDEGSNAWTAEPRDQKQGSG